MSSYRRCYVPGGSYFFTVVTERRAKILGNDLIRDLLPAAFQDCCRRWPPFRVDAMVMLQDHMHAICKAWAQVLNCAFLKLILGRERLSPDLNCLI